MLPRWLPYAEAYLCARLKAAAPVAAPATLANPYGPAPRSAAALPEATMEAEEKPPPALGTVDAQKLQDEADAQIMWGKDPDTVRKKLTGMGATPTEAGRAVQRAQQRRKDTLKRLGSQDLVMALLLLGVGTLGLLGGLAIESPRKLAAGFLSFAAITIALGAQKAWRGTRRRAGFDDGGAVSAAD